MCVYVATHGTCHLQAWFCSDLVWGLDMEFVLMLATDVDKYQTDTQRQLLHDALPGLQLQQHTAVFIDSIVICTAGSVGEVNSPC